MHSALKKSLAVVGVLFAGVLLAAPLEPRDPNKEAQAAIIQLGDNLDADDVPARAQKIVKEHASDAISSVFARRSGGGLGIGNAVRTESQNSIERLVREWSAGRASDRDSMEKHHADYVKVTKVIAAMAELAPYRMPEHVVKQQFAHAEWMRVAREFKTGAAELGKAVQMKDPARIKKLAGVLHHTCCDCHSLL